MTIVIAKNVMVLQESYIIYKTKPLLQYVKESKKISDMIPDEEKDKVWGYNIDSYFYIASDIQPCYRFFMMQDWMCKSSEEMRGELEENIKSLEAKYIITGIENENAFDYIIEENYCEVGKTETMMLLKKNEK